MASTTAATTATAPSRTKAAAKRKPRSRSSTALRDARFRTIQLVLFAAGAVLMPLGIIVISLGWYGTAHSHYDYDQRTYLISGGILGLGLTFVGGFLYFGAWLAKAASDQRDSSRQLADALQVLADVIVRQGGAPRAGETASDTGPIAVANGAELVFAGEGTTIHRRDCALIAHRDDLRPITGNEVNPSLCRVCRPTLD
jgi:hypothetical protein